MRITRDVLVRRWLMATIVAVALFIVVGLSDQILKARTGFGTADLQTFNTAAQYRAALFVWSRPGASFGVQAGFILGLEYLLIPLYALSFYLSAILAREAFPRKATRIRRILTLLAAVPIAGALLDALGTGLEMALLQGRASDGLAHIVHIISGPKWAALYVGVVLLAGGLLAYVDGRRARRIPRDET
jgi:hypothetical protein